MIKEGDAVRKHTGGKSTGSGLVGMIAPKLGLAIAAGANRAVVTSDHIGWAPKLSKLRNADATDEELNFIGM